MPRFILSEKDRANPKNKHLLAEAHALGFECLEYIECHNVYYFADALSTNEQDRLSRELLIDSFTQEGSWETNGSASVNTHAHTIEVVFRPGVTDAVANEIARRAQSLGIDNAQRIATGQRFFIYSKSLKESDLSLLAEKLLCNTVIQQYALHSLSNVFADQKSPQNSAQPIPILGCSTAQLDAISKNLRAALDETEMLAIKHYFEALGRNPTDIEFEMIAQTWSEHCSHKTFKALIEKDGYAIEGLLNTYLKRATDEIAAPWVHSAFVDNAGIIDFDDDFQISFKVETHNHPSAIEPFGGANTGLGGVIRDILGVSAKPIAATDIFCFGPEHLAMSSVPEGSLHPRLIAAGVIAGVQDYGNKTGIPTVNGAIYYDDGFVANPLVYCGCVGLAPKNMHPRNPQIHDRIIVLGARTGRDGIRGATFSSMTMDAQSGVVAGASVQIGDPIAARGLIEVVTQARDRKLYHAITDCGAGGLSSAVGEMASELGADVELSNVKLKYLGLASWEIWLSEAQERMVLAVLPDDIHKLKELCEIYDVELTDIGEITNTKRNRVTYLGQEILNLDNDFLYKGMPQKKLYAPSLLRSDNTIFKHDSKSNPDYRNIILKLLAHPNIASKAHVIRRYDHEVQGATLIRPLIGVNNDGPSDACVLKPLETAGTCGIVLANGINPEIGKVDPYAMAVSTVDEAIRNAVAVGANPKRIAILDNFCFGNPKRPEVLHALIEAAQGCYDAAILHRTPFISGKDSLNNEYVGADGKRHAIPATLLISAIGIIDDVKTAVSMDFKEAGNFVYLLGETKAHFGGSHWGIVAKKAGGLAPELAPHAPQLYDCLHQAIKNGFVRACHDLSEGGLAVAAAEMCIAGRLGCRFTIVGDHLTALFSESNARFLVEVEPSNQSLFENYFIADIRHLLTKIGVVTNENNLIAEGSGRELFNISLESMLSAYFANHEM